jgi:nitrogen fixation protein NifQ
MRAEEAYRWLTGTSARSVHDAFDIHVVASIFALAMEEADNADVGVADGVGLAGHSRCL